jgi:hypothetical protein
MSGRFEEDQHPQEARQAEAQAGRPRVGMPVDDAEARDELPTVREGGRLLS